MAQALSPDSVPAEISALVEKARTSWLANADVNAVLECQRQHNLPLNVSPPHMPPGGQLFLIDRHACERFRKDGLCWAPKENRAHPPLKVGGVPTLDCYYAYSEPLGLERRSYWRKDRDQVVLMHYLQASAAAAAGHKTKRRRGQAQPEQEQQLRSRSSAALPASTSAPPGGLWYTLLHPFGSGRSSQRQQQQQQAPPVAAEPPALQQQQLLSGMSAPAVMGGTSTSTGFVPLEQLPPPGQLAAMPLGPQLSNGASLGLEDDPDGLEEWLSAEQGSLDLVAAFSGPTDAEDSHPHPSAIVSPPQSPAPPPLQRLSSGLLRRLARISSGLSGKLGHLGSGGNHSWGMSRVSMGRSHASTHDLDGDAHMEDAVGGHLAGGDPGAEEVEMIDQPQNAMRLRSFFARGPSASKREQAAAAAVREQAAAAAAASAAGAAGAHAQGSTDNLAQQYQHMTLGPEAGQQKPPLST